MWSTYCAICQDCILSLCVCKFKYLPLLMWKSLCPLHRPVKSSLLHLQLPETWTSERLLMNQYSPLDAMAFKWVLVFRIYMLNASSVVLLLLLYDLSPYRQVSRDAGLRLQTSAWKALAYKGSFLRGPLGDVWHSRGSWFAFLLGLVEFSDAGCLLAALLFFCLAQIPVFFLSFSLSLLLAFAS